MPENARKTALICHSTPRAIPMCAGLLRLGILEGMNMPVPWPAALAAGYVPVEGVRVEIVAEGREKNE